MGKCFHSPQASGPTACVYVRGEEKEQEEEEEKEEEEE